MSKVVIALMAALFVCVGSVSEAACRDCRRLYYFASFKAYLISFIRKAPCYGIGA